MYILTIKYNLKMLYEPNIKLFAYKPAFFVISL